MEVGELITVKRQSREYGKILSYHADDTLAAALPDLGLPRMGEAARAALRAVLDHEMPPSGGWMSDCLALAQARGFCFDPRDWLPSIDLPGGHLPLYQPWVDWIAENGLAPFHEYNTLTAANWGRWKPKPLAAALSRTRLNQVWMTELVLNHSPAMSVTHREMILCALTASRDENVVHSWQVPLIRHFLGDRAAKIRDAARSKLQGKLLDHWHKEHAEALAQHLNVQNGRVCYAERHELHAQPFYHHWNNTTFADLARTLGMTPAQLAHGGELDFLDSQFVALATLTGDAEARTIMAKRLLATREPAELPLWLFRDLDSGIRERALEAQFQSPYINSVQEFLGAERGFLTPDQMHRMSAFESIEKWLAIHLEKRILPVNLQYDPLRAVALSVGKEAAQEALDLAQAAGMKPDNPRLTMLYFNLAL